MKIAFWGKCKNTRITRKIKGSSHFRKNSQNHFGKKKTCFWGNSFVFGNGFGKMLERIEIQMWKEHQLFLIRYVPYHNQVMYRVFSNLYICQDGTLSRLHPPITPWYRCNSFEFIGDMKHIADRGAGHISRWCNTVSRHMCITKFQNQFNFDFACHFWASFILYLELITPIYKINLDGIIVRIGGIWTAEYARIDINTNFNKKIVKSCVEFYSICYILVVDRKETVDEIIRSRRSWEKFERKT